MAITVHELLTRFGGPAGLRTAERRRPFTVARTAAPRVGEHLMADPVAALDRRPDS